MHRYCSTSNQLCAALHICWLYCKLLTYALARRQEMKWGVFFVKSGPFPTKWNETGSNVACFVSYDSNQLFTIYDLQSWNANVTFSHNKCGKITVKHWELDLFFILHFTYLGGVHTHPMHPPPAYRPDALGAELASIYTAVAQLYWWLCCREPANLAIEIAAVKPVFALERFGICSNVL